MEKGALTTDDSKWKALLFQKNGAMLFFCEGWV